jgi:eukaryotic-like serine/threonine-protein kinase
VPLVAGSRLGPYEIVAPIGAGGMGEVYLALDPRLNREVAIKVLPADRHRDDVRRRRFVQEAQAASALNHPGIITIFEIESEGGRDFIVMEYVRGKSLDQLIPRQGMRLTEALRVAIAVSEALAAAHAKGIVHRDLKPANVMIGVDGRVKVLDFGLAKLTSQDSSPIDETHTLSSVNQALSTPGMVVGTAAYMSPEQASGGEVDHRSDIFSFGSMLFEMVSGVRPFAGASMSETLEAVRRAQPARVGDVARGIPLELDTIIRRCLRKEPERRFQHVVDVAVALRDIKEETDSGVAPLQFTEPSPRPWPRGLGLALALGVVVLLGVAWLIRSRTPIVVPAMRVVPLTALKGSETRATFSPDGRQVAFSWNGSRDIAGIYVTMPGGTDVRPLIDASADSYAPVWSPDGSQIAFVRWTPDGTQIRKTSAVGGSDVRVADFAPHFAVMTWSPDSASIVAGLDARARGGASGLYLIPADGGTPRAITHPQGMVDLVPAYSPDGQRLAYASCKLVRKDWLGACALFETGVDATWAPIGTPKRITPEGTPALEPIAWTRDGKSIMFSGRQGGLGVSYLWRVAADGSTPPERLELAGMRSSDVAISASGNELAFTRGYEDLDIYAFRPDTGASDSVVASSYAEDGAQWSPDGQRIAFCSSRGLGASVDDVWIAAADGSAAHQVTHGPGSWQCSPQWSPDGRTIAFDSLGADNLRHIWTIDAEGGTPRQITSGDVEQNIPSWSRDGRFVYFAANSEIWKVAASGGTPQQVTHGGAEAFASESIDGTALLYQPLRGQMFFDAPILSQPLAGGAATELVGCARHSGFRPMADGLYYVSCEPPGTTIHVVQARTGKDRRVGSPPDSSRDAPSIGLAVSPDGKTILYTRQVGSGSDLMLIENFH